MVRLAPRYDPRIAAAVAALDEPDQPIAETCRRVAAYAESLGLTRPSYSHLRRIVRDERDRVESERARNAEIRKIAADVCADVVAGRAPVDPYELAGRIRRAGTGAS